MTWHVAIYPSQTHSNSVYYTLKFFLYPHDVGSSSTERRRTIREFCLSFLPAQHPRLYNKSSKTHMYCDSICKNDTGMLLFTAASLSDSAPHVKNDRTHKKSHFCRSRTCNMCCLSLQTTSIGSPSTRRVTPLPSVPTWGTKFRKKNKYLKLAM